MTSARASPCLRPGRATVGGCGPNTKGRSLARAAQSEQRAAGQSSAVWPTWSVGFWLAGHSWATRERTPLSEGDGQSRAGPCWRLGPVPDAQDMPLIPWMSPTHGDKTTGWLVSCPVLRSGAAPCTGAGPAPPPFVLCLFPNTPHST